MLCLVVLSVWIILMIDLNHSIRIIITDSVTNSIYFIVLKLCRIQTKLNVRVAKTVLRIIVKASSGLIITVHRNMIALIIYLPLELHSYSLRSLQRFTMVLEKYFGRKSLCSLYTWFFLWNTESLNDLGSWKVHTAFYSHHWQVLPFDFLVVTFPYFGCVLLLSHFRLPLMLLLLLSCLTLFCLFLFLFNLDLL